MEFPRLRKLNEQQTTIIPKNKINFQIKHPEEANRIIRHPTNPK
jgi:hypothetical protein